MLSGSFLQAAINDLYQQLIPKITNDEISDLEEIIHAAQSRAPPNRFAFVTKINRILDAHQLVLSLKDGHVGKLKVNPPAAPHGRIQISADRRTRGFKNQQIRVVRASELNSSGPQEEGADHQRELT